MLRIVNHLHELSFEKLMAVYEEGNRENGRELWPELSQGEQLLRAEQDFYRYLREVFFPTPQARYCVLEEGGVYRSALRLEPYRDGLLLEALETAPPYRRRGYATALVQAVLDTTGTATVYSHVGKRNEPSLRTHRRCGFVRVLDYAVYADGSVNDYCCTLRYSPK